MTAALEDRVLLALGQKRAWGGPFIADILGIKTRILPGGETELASSSEPLLEHDPFVSQLELAVSADIALASTIGYRLGTGLRATATISLHYRTQPYAGPFRSRGSVTVADEGQALAACSLEVGGDVIGQAHGWFAPAAITPGPGLRPPRWARAELPEVEVPARGDLDDVEAEVLATVLRAADEARRKQAPLFSELMACQSESRASEDEWTAEIDMGPVFANRTNYVQGGVLYATAAMAAQRVATLQPVNLAEGYYQFLRPATLGPLGMSARALRQGRSRSFVEVTLTREGKLVGVGLFSFA